MLRSFYKLYLMLIVSVVVSAIVVVPGMQYLFVSHSVNTEFEGVRSELYVMRDTLAMLPEARRAATITERQATFPLVEYDLSPRSAWHLSPSQNLALDRGYAVDNGPGQVIVAIPPSDRILRLTQPKVALPVQVFVILAWSMVATVVVSGLFLWLRSHWRDLETLRIAAERFGEGNLHVRAALSERSSIGPLAKRFDSMAARIETLVSTQNDMIHAISHELRTPIARFGFGLALLQSAKTKEEERRHIEALGRDISELDQLVGELLSYGELAQHERPTGQRQVNIVELIDSVIGSLALEMELLDIQYTSSVSVAAEQVVLDPRLTARALINLVKNAMRYGHGKVAISAAVSRGELVVCVDDDGIGIPEDDRKTIFEPFHRLDRSRDRDTGGFGLGLAIVMRAIGTQGGSVRVVDSPMGGARFEVRLPMHRGVGPVRPVTA